MIKFTDDTKKRTALDSLRASLWAERTSGYDATWRDLADYFAPRRVRFQDTDKNRGQRRTQYILDSTARFSARTLASGLHSGLTSPARPWMKLALADAKLMKAKNVQSWLAEVTSRMLMIFETSNLYNTLPTVYGDLGVFGTAAMSMVDDTRDLFRTYAYPLGSFAMAQDDRGMVNTFVRDFRLNVEQTIAQYAIDDPTKPNDVAWDRVPAQLKVQYDRGDYVKPVNIDVDRLPESGL